MKGMNEARMRFLFFPGCGGCGASEALERLRFCIEGIGRSKEITLNDAVIPDWPPGGQPMDFEELTGALLAAESALKGVVRAEEDAEDAEDDRCLGIATSREEVRS